jgi:hypothetical protein
MGIGGGTDSTLLPSSFAGAVGLEMLAFELMDSQDHLVARRPEPDLSVGGAIRWRHQSVWVNSSMEPAWIADLSKARSWASS